MARPCKLRRLLPTSSMDSSPRLSTRSRKKAAPGQNMRLRNLDHIRSQLVIASWTKHHNEFMLLAAGSHWRIRSAQQTFHFCSAVFFTNPSFHLGRNTGLFLFDLESKTRVKRPTY